MTKPKRQITPEDEITFNLLDTHTVDRLRRTGDVKLPRRTLDVPKDEKWNTKQMSSRLLQGILNGDSIPKIADRLMDIVGNNEVSAIRNARTMVTGAENVGRLDSYKDLAEKGVVQRKIWIATLDDRTRESHAEIDGEEVEIDKAFSNGLMYPGDTDPSVDPSEVWNCRCSMRDHIIGFRRADGSISYVEGEEPKNEVIQTEETALVSTSESEKSTEEAKPVEAATLDHYDETYQEFRAERADQIDDMTPFDEMTEMLNDLVENNEFRTRIPDDSANILEHILDDEKFKTQFETDDSMGVYAPATRMRASHNLFGTDVGSMDDSQWEKYGYLGSKDILKDRSIGLAGYGDGIVTFDKDALFDRTTLTVGDSLRDAGETGRYIMGTMVNDIDSTVCIGRPSSIDTYVRLMQDSIEKDGIDNASRVGHAVRSYIELQYHGDVTLADVESITIRKDIWDEIAQNPDRVNALRENNISCYYIDYENKELKEYVFE